jgi:hypothetical protein
MGVNKAKHSHRDLYAAIGRVASTSAILEDALRRMLRDLSDTEYSEQAWFLLEGQSTEWLIKSCEVMLKNVVGLSNPWYKYRTQVTEYLRDCRDLQKSRNVVIHGVWRDFCAWSGEQGLCTPRPSNSREDDRIYYFMKSSQKNAFQCVHLAVSDIQALANRIQRVGSELWQLKDEVEGERRRRWAEKHGRTAEM